MDLELHNAARIGDEAEAGLLLHQGHNVNQQTSTGYTALHWAAGNGHLNMVRLLLNQGADINSKLQNGFTALHITAMEGHQEVARLLLNQAGINVNAKADLESTAEDLACYNRHTAIATLIQSHSSFVYGS
ncbi:unnamed protein product [Meganyctiphanes norvegica]|uniref:Uncharacterized protein n=1 Tax=Meganyctiphanes norvegica TaxID=48144 RepID=A0AAV2R658_MEGNR